MSAAPALPPLATSQPRVVSALGRGRRLRVGFVMEQVLGHVTWYQNLRRAVERLNRVDARWVETRLYEPNGHIERVRWLPDYARAGLRARLDMRRGLEGLRCDALVFNTQKTAMLCQPELLRTPSLLLTDVTPCQYDRMARLYEHVTGGNAAVRQLKHAVNALNFRLAAAVLPCSTWARDSLVHEYGVPPERVHVLPIGVDTSYWRPSPQVWPPGPVRLLFVGGHFERKGGQLLLDVFRSLALHEHAELHIVTRDDVAPERGVVVHRGLANNSPELLRLYQGADLFVLPTMADCFSNVALEAMAVGLPVVITHMGGIPDIVADGRTGYLLPPGDGAALATALRSLVDDTQRRRAFGRAGRQRAVTCFDAGTNTARILDLAHHVVMRRRSHRSREA